MGFPLTSHGEERRVDKPAKALPKSCLRQPYWRHSSERDGRSFLDHGQWADGLLHLVEPRWADRSWPLFSPSPELQTHPDALFPSADSWEVGY